MQSRVRVMLSALSATPAVIFCARAARPGRLRAGALIDQDPASRLHTDFSSYRAQT